MKRREFITFLGGAAATWPLTARAQEPRRVIGVLSSFGSSGFFAEAWTAFSQGLGRWRRTAKVGTGGEEGIRTLDTALDRITV